MLKSEPEYVYDERGFPTLRKPWRGEIPEIPTFLETDSGKRRVGAIEIMMDYVIKEWIITNENEMEFCTSVHIAEQCTLIDGKPTSTSSVNRVLELWEAMGYCTLFRKPFAFAAFTTNGMEWGLDELHRLHKRKLKREKESGQRSALSLTPRRKKR